MPIYNWTMTASHQSQVPIIFSLATILLAVTLPVMGGVLLAAVQPPRQELRRQRTGTTSNEMLIRCWSEVNGSVRW